MDKLNIQCQRKGLFYSRIRLRKMAAETYGWRKEGKEKEESCRLLLLKLSLPDPRPLPVQPNAQPRQTSWAQCSATDPAAAPRLVWLRPGL